MSAFKKLFLLIAVTSFMGACSHYKKKGDCGCGKTKAEKSEEMSCKENHDHSMHEKHEKKEDKATSK